ETLAPLVPVTSTAATTAATTTPTTSDPTGASVATTPPPATAPPTTLVPARPVRILVVGDSTAEATATGLIAWADAHPELATVSLAVKRGCGFLPGGDIWSDDGWREVSADCDDWL